MALQLDVLASTTSDNFFYLLYADGEAMLVDPIDDGTAIGAVRQLELELVAILNTHWHPDHVGGNAAVREAFPEARLIGPREEAEQIEQFGELPLDGGVTGGDTIRLGAHTLKVLNTPGHTAGHISFEVEGHLLSGDTIFSAGAGNCRFGGDASALFDTFANILPTLDEDLTVYPGHDYALRNIEFGLSLMPADEALLEAKARVASLGERELGTTTLGQERIFNLFMRYAQAPIIEALKRDHADTFDEIAGQADTEHEAVFCTLRALRDNW